MDAVKVAEYHSLRIFCVRNFHVSTFHVKQFSHKWMMYENLPRRNIIHALKFHKLLGVRKYFNTEKFPNYGICHCLMAIQSHIGCAITEWHYTNSTLHKTMYD